MAFGYGHGTPQAARDVAEAFFAGKKRTRTNCRTDGTEYILVNAVIARRVRDEDRAENIANLLAGERYRRPLEFTFAEWATDMTARHLNAFPGIRAEVRKGDPFINGRMVSSGRWYTHDEINALPVYVEPPKPLRSGKERFVQLTAELFPA